MTMTPGASINGADCDPYPHRREMERESGSTSTYILVTNTEPRRWAIVQRHVSGWDCLAVGEFAPTFPEDSLDATFDLVTRNYGDGFAHIPTEHYAVSHPESENIHHRRSMAPGEIAAYCGVPAATPYVHKRRPGRYEQHCTGCTTAYRAENYGRCPVEAH